ncbi:MAG: ABC transporter ATP-binding protein [Phycisphaerae bacterium]
MIGVSNMTDLIDIRNASKTYHTGEVDVHAVRDVSIGVPGGQFVALTGPSGSGKSTFMHMLGLLDRLDSGTYLLEGKPVQGLSRTQLAALRGKRIGYVFQSFNLLSRTTIVDNVALPLVYQGVSRRERRKRASAMLDRVGLGKRLSHTSNQLSGGQQQRVAIARALVTRPALVLADEPTGNLDSATSVDIMNLLAQLNRDEKLTIVLVTHEPDIAGYAGRLVVFRDGKIVQDELRTPTHAVPATAA